MGKYEFIFFTECNYMGLYEIYVRYKRGWFRRMIGFPAKEVFWFSNDGHDWYNAKTLKPVSEKVWYDLFCIKNRYLAENKSKVKHPTKHEVDK